MLASDLLEQVAAFNDHLQTNLWLDIELRMCSPHTLVLDCGIDLSSKPDVEMRFGTVFFTSILMSWKTDTSVGHVMQVVSGLEAVKLNEQYQVERGFHLFAFQPEGLSGEASCLIAAKEFSWRVTTDK